MHLFLLELSSVVKRVKTLGESLLAAQAEVTLSPFTCNTRVWGFEHDCKGDKAWLSGARLIFFSCIISCPTLPCCTTLQIWRNAVAAKVNAHNWQPRLLPIDWPDAPASDEAFWQLKAQLVDGTLKIVEAAGPFAHPPRLENQPKFNQKQQPQPPRLRAANPQPQAQQQTETNTETVDWENIIAVSGKLELTIKINTLPQVHQVNGEYHFKIDCDGHVFQVLVKPKLWAKLETASTSYQQWIAAISGKLGTATADGFALEQPNIQVFERQSKTGASSKQEQAGVTETLASEQSKAAGSTSPKVGTKTQTAPKDAAAQLVMKPEEKSDPVNPLAKPAAPKAEAKPKKIGKFNVEVR